MTVISQERHAIEAALARLPESYFTHLHACTRGNPLAIDVAYSAAFP